MSSALCERIDMATLLNARLVAEAGQVEYNRPRKPDRFSGAFPLGVAPSYVPDQISVPLQNDLTSASGPGFGGAPFYPWGDSSGWFQPPRSPQYGFCIPPKSLLDLGWGRQDRETINLCHPDYPIAQLSQREHRGRGRSRGKTQCRCSASAHTLRNAWAQAGCHHRPGAWCPPVV